VLAGQFTVLETYAWWPLLLYAIDRASARAGLGAVLLGAGALTMMILAGHPPTALMAGFATALYCLPALWFSRARLRLLGSLAAIATLPVLLSAVQLWTGLDTAREGIRQEGMSFTFATSHSFPPEQMLTLFAPTLFGHADRFNLSYFGRVFYWDATVFIGVVAFVLAVYGALASRGRLRNTALGLTALLAVIAMGGYTPVYRLLFHVVPGFGFVRAPSKFMFFAAVFASVLVALGVDRLFERAEAREEGAASPGRSDAALGRAVLLALALSGGAATLALMSWLSPSSAETPSAPMALLLALPRSLDYAVVSAPADWQPIFVRALVVGAAWAGIAAAGLWWAGRSRRGVWLVIAVALLELVVFARMHRGSTWLAIDLAMRKGVLEAYRLAGTDYRVMETAAPSNVAVGRRAYNIWGYDPVILGRYARFMAVTQGAGHAQMKHTTHLHPGEHHPLLDMLRLRYRVEWRTGEIQAVGRPLPHFLLLRDYLVRDGERAVLREISQPGFDPRKTVVLESEPVPSPRTAREGAASVPAARAPGGERLWLLDASSDHFDIEAQLREPALLLITDSYSEGWRAQALEGSDQASYQLLPANYVLRAVPLAAGHHRLRIEYAPAAFRAGLWTSVVSGGLYGVAAAGLGVRRLRSGGRG